MKQLTTLIFLLFSCLHLFADDVSYEVTHPQQHNNCLDGKIDLIISGGYAPYEVVYEILFVHPVFGNAWLEVYSVSGVDGTDGTEDYEDAREGQYRVTVTDFHCGKVTLMIDKLVCECAPCEINGEITEPACLGDDGGSINIQMDCDNQDNGPFQAVWADGERGMSRSELNPGRYCVTVTDAFDCDTEKCWWLGTSNSLDPVLVAKANPTFCGVGENTCDGSLTIAVNGGVPPYQIVWSNGSTSNKISGLCSGNYSVTIIDDQGCRLSETYELCCCEPGGGGDTGTTTSCVSEPLELDFSVGGLPNGFINISISGGAGSISCSWDVNTADGGLSNHTDFGCNGISNINTEGEYCFTASDGCTSVGKCFNIIDCSNSDLTVSGSGSSTCPDLNAGIASLSISGGNPEYNVQWSNGISGRGKTEINRLFVGTYCATVTDNNFCTAETCITIDDNNGVSSSSTFEPCITKHECNGVTIDVDEGVYTDTPANGLCEFLRFCSETATPLPVSLFPSTIISTVGCTRVHSCLNGVSDTEIGQTMTNGPFGVSTANITGLVCNCDQGCTSSSVCVLTTRFGASENVPLSPAGVSCATVQTFACNSEESIAMCGSSGESLRKWTCGTGTNIMTVKDTCLTFCLDGNDVTTRNALESNEKPIENTNKSILSNSILIRPNPVSNNEDITITIINRNLSNSIFLHIYDMSGRQVFDKEIIVDNLIQTEIKLKLNNFPSGIYFVKFTENDAVHDIKKLILH